MLVALVKILFELSDNRNLMIDPIYKQYIMMELFNISLSARAK